MHVPNASQISCGWWTCAVLKKDGTVVAFGIWKDSPTITNASFVDCGQNGCAALKNDGTVVSWGHPDRFNGPLRFSITNAIQVSCGDVVSAAVLDDGRVVAWGQAAEGGTNGPVPGLTDAKHVHCDSKACVALKNDGTIFAWGDSRYGGNAPGGITKAIYVKCSHQVCGALTRDGKVYTWGHGGYGGNVIKTNMVQFDCGYQACAGVTKEGTVVTWGSSRHGGDMLCCDSAALDAPVTNVSHVTCGLESCSAFYNPSYAVGGGDPHFRGFGDVFFTWQGHCDVMLLKAPQEDKEDFKLEIHVRTSKIRKWSKIDAIAFKAGEDVGEIKSDDGKLVLNEHEVDSAKTRSLSVAKSKIKKSILVYAFVFAKNKKLEVKVNTRSQMIYTTFTGDFPLGTEGILGSPHNPGLISRNGAVMSSKDVNTFVESWQIKDSDPQLFHANRMPQFPSKCIYEMKETLPSRRLKEFHTTTRKEATAACAMHKAGTMREFCIDDVMMTGDIDSASDEFYG